MTTFAKTVGVAPGTTTMRLGDIFEYGHIGPKGRALRGYYNPYQDMIQLTGLGAVDTSAHIRWDLIALVGGGSLFVAMMAGLIASAVEHRFAQT